RCITARFPPGEACRFCLATQLINKETKMSLGDQFTDYVRACFTGLWIETSEQNEAIQEIQQLCQTQHWDCQVWDIEQGLQPPASDSETLGQGDPLAPLTQV